MGVSIDATDEDIKDELMLLLKAGMAGAESKKTSERVRANIPSVSGSQNHMMNLCQAES